MIRRRSIASAVLSLRERRFFTSKIGRGGRSVKTTLAAVLAVALTATIGNNSLAWENGDMITHV
jgi:hypothetical protein